MRKKKFTSKSEADALFNKKIKAGNKYVRLTSSFKDIKTGKRTYTVYWRKRRKRRKK